MTRIFGVKSIKSISDIAEGILRLAPYIILLVSGFAALLLWSRNYASYVFLVASVTLGSIAYILLNRKFGSIDLDKGKHISSGRFVKTPQKFLTVLYILLFCLSILTLAYGFYSKSLLYYISVSLCAGIIFIEIAFSSHHQKPWWILAKIYLLFINISLSNQLIFPYGIGSPDDFYHIYNIMVPAIETGHVPDGYTYSHFPCHQIIGAITSLISGTLPRMTYYYLGTFFMSLGILFIYIIGSKFLGTKFGLITALMYACCDYILYWAGHPVQLSYAYPIALMIVGIVLCSSFHKRLVGLKIVFISLTLLMIFTHHYTATIVLFLLMVICSLEIVYLEKQKSRKRDLIWFTSIYLFILFCQWIYYSHLFSGFIGIVDTYIDVFTTDVSSSVASATVYDAIPIGTLLLNEIGSCILLFFSTIGALYCIHHRSKFFDAILAMILLLGAMIGVGALINVYYLMPNRVYVFLQQFALVFLAGIALLWFLHNSKGSKGSKGALKKVGAITLLVVCLSFFSSASTIAGFETSLFTKDLPYWKFYETPHERYSCTWGEKDIGNNNVAGSGSLICPVKNLSFVKYPIIETEHGFLPDISDRNESYVQFNRFDTLTSVLYQRVMGYHMGCNMRVKLSSDSEYSFETLDKIYDNKMLSTYFRFQP